MTDQEKQELNVKLAEWAGFVWYDEPCSYKGCTGHCGWHYPSGVTIYPLGMQGLPNFIDSLDACFAWLVPKLEYYCLTPEDNGRGFYTDVSIGERYEEYFQAETQPLALCLVIEKLIK